VLAIACALLVGIVAAPIARAAGASFGGEGAEAGKFARAQAVAVDNGDPLSDSSAGDVYVADAGNNRIEKFTASGEFIVAWGWGVADGREEFETCGPDASPATTTCQAGSEGSGAGQFAEPGGIAVDETAGLSNGDVYIEDERNNRIERFSPSGELLLAWGWGVADGSEEAQVCGPAAVPATGSCLPGLEGTGVGEFESLRSNTVAVDATGSVDVGDGRRVEKFSSAGALTSEVALAGTADEVNALVVDAAGNFFVARSEEGSPAGVREYDSAGSEIGTLDLSGGFGSAIALGSAEEVFVFDSGNRVSEYQAGGSEIANFPVTEGTTSLDYGDQAKELYLSSEVEVHLLAPSPSGPLVESTTVNAKPMGAATVSVTIDPEGQQTKFHLEYGTQAANEATTPPITLVGEGFEPEVVEVQLTNLDPNTLYRYRVVADNGAGTVVSKEQTFATLPPVSIDNESVSQVSSVSARLATTLNPLGLPTEYRFEYGPTSAYGTHVPVPDGDAGSGLTGVPRTALVEGLSPGTPYHYRVVAHNGFGETVGADHVFTTQAASSTSLIDGRQWELVSPPDKHGSVLEAITPEGGAIQAAEDGNALAYVARDPVTSGPAGNRSFAEQQLVATRGADGWSTQEIATPHENISGLQAGELSEYRQFSEDLLVGAVEPRGNGLLSPWASERTPYIRQPSGEYRPVVSGCPQVGSPCASLVEEHADVPPGMKFGTTEEGGRLNVGTGVEFVVATPDLTHALLIAPQSLVAGFENEGQQALYEWGGGHLKPASVLPGGMPATGGVGAVVGQEDKMVRNAISADGRRVSFESNGHLYSRDMSLGQSVQLDAPEEGAAGSVNASASYQYASEDGTKVFFTDAARLTTDSTASARTEKADLYMCDLGTSSDERSCASKRTLSDLTVGFNGEAADIRGLALGGAADGSTVYLVANGILANAGIPVAGAVHGDCGAATEDELCNLYVWHQGAIALVAVLSGNDAPDWQGSVSTFSGIHSNLSALTARVSSNGRYLGFMSSRSLTGYDNHDAKSGAADAEVFLYDANTDRTVCASCDPTGGRPRGVLEPANGEENALLVDRIGAWRRQWVAGSIPGWTPIKLADALYQSRYLSNEGRLFFNTPVSLVSADANGTQDVYEFEPDGVGDCGTGLSSTSATFVKEVAGDEVDGCEGLISSGAASEESAFLDAGGKGIGGAEGEDVFYLTSAKLVKADGDGALDVYDAHICSASSPCPSTSAATVPTCITTDSCRAAPPPQPDVFGAPATATSTSGGNVAPTPTPKSKPKLLTRAQKLKRALETCRHKYPKGKSVRKRIACEKRARHSYGVSHSRKTTRVKKADRAHRKATS
jgi:hypothetical protein